MIIEFKRDYIQIINNSSTAVAVKIMYGDSILEEITIIENSNYEYKPVKDGVYTITDDIDSVSVYYYLYHIKLFIQRFKNLLCNCMCDDCNNVYNDKYEDLTYLNMLSNKIKAVIPGYCTFNSKYYENNRELIFNGEICNPEQVILSGNNLPDKNSLIKSLEYTLLLDYATLYLVIKNLMPLEEDYVNDLFYIDKINCCYKEYGLDFNNIINTINMAILNINFQEYINQPPTVIGNSVTSDNRVSIHLTKADLIDNAGYNDPEGDPADAIKITSLPATTGVTLKHNGNPVVIDQIITVADLDTYGLDIDAPDIDLAVSDSFNYVVRDTGSLEWSN